MAHWTGHSGHVTVGHNGQGTVDRAQWTGHSGQDIMGRGHTGQCTDGTQWIGHSGQGTVVWA